MLKSTVILGIIVGILFIVAYGIAEIFLPTIIASPLFMAIGAFIYFKWESLETYWTILYVKVEFLLSRNLEKKYMFLISLIRHDSGYCSVYTQNEWTLIITTYKNPSKNSYSRDEHMEWCLRLIEEENGKNILHVDVRYLTGTYREDFRQEFLPGENQQFIYSRMMNGINKAKIQYLEEEKREA